MGGNGLNLKWKISWHCPFRGHLKKPFLAASLLFGSANRMKHPSKRDLFDLFILKVNCKYDDGESFC
jgi:hypothetical protein